MVAEIRFGVKTIDHIAIPVRDLGANQRFYTDILGLGPLVPIACRDEMMIRVQSGQMIGLVEVRELSDRSKKHGRGCHMGHGSAARRFRLDGCAGGTLRGKNPGESTRG